MAKEYIGTIPALQEGITKVGRQYNGPAILLPSLHQIAAASGLTPPKLYGDTTPLDKLAAATGLREVWRDGYVLGDPGQVKEIKPQDLPEPGTPVDLDGLTAHALANLDPATRRELARRITEN